MAFADEGGGTIVLPRAGTKMLGCIFHFQAVWQAAKVQAVTEPPDVFKEAVFLPPVAALAVEAVTAVVMHACVCICYVHEVLQILSYMYTCIIYYICILYYNYNLFIMMYILTNIEI